MTDYIPNDPKCPECGGGGMRGTLPVFSTWHDCHCQHPVLAFDASLADLRELARRVVDGKISEDDAAELAGEICTRHGPAAVAPMDDYYEERLADYRGARSVTS
jgi:hypothetical protein